MKALIFDVDGTLADTERDGHRVAFNRAFEAANLDWYWDEATYGELLSVTGGKERMNYYVEQYDKKEKDDPNLQQTIIELHKNKTGHYVELLNKNAIPLRPGVVRLLNEAREAGLRLAIATTTTPENVTALLSSALGEDSIQWFEVIGAGDVVPHKKPAADIYHYVLQKMSLQASDCIAFEDSDNGIRSSTAAGLKTVITYNGYTRNDDFSAAMLVLDQLGDEEHVSEELQRQFQQPFLTLDLLQQLDRS